MAETTHVERLRASVATWNAWRREHPDVEPNLSGADLRGAVLVDAYLARANLSKASLSRANLSSANFGRSNLTGADLSHANLFRAILSTADLTKTDLSNAHLREAQLNGTILEHAQLSDANLRGAFLMNANLTDAALQNAKLIGANLNVARLVRADLTGADLKEVSFRNADLSGALLINCDMERATLVDSKLPGAQLVNCAIYGINAWNLDLTGARQDDLIVTSATEPVVRVDDLEVAQFIYLLLNNAKIRNVIDSVTAKAVLILGRFTPERKAILDALRSRLRTLGLLPILFDFDKSPNRTIQETVSTLASLARFVIADITDPKSIPQELTDIVRVRPSVPVQPILQVGWEPWSMYESIAIYPWVLEVEKYKDVDDLLANLTDRVIQPAEQKAVELENKLRAVRASLN